MGLDNGIIVRHREGRPIYIPRRYYDYVYELGGNSQYEIAYWRKCWGLRDKILDILNIDQSDYDSYDINLDREDIKNIIKLLKKFTKKDYWNKYADSIWSFDIDIYKRQKRIIRNLKFIHWRMRLDPEINVYFYDSY